MSAVVCYKGDKPSIDDDEMAKKQFLFLCGFIIFFMIAFRSIYNGSTDTMHYYDNWENLSKIHFAGLEQYFEETTMEKFYVYTVWFLSKFFINPRWLFVFTGAFFSYSVCRFLYKNCEDVLLGVYVFVTMGLFNFMVQGLRQAIAMSICLFAFEHAKKRKPVKFALVVLLALLYHKSAVAFFAVYFLYGRKLKFSNVVGLSSLFLIVLAISNVILSWGNETFDRGYNDAAQGGGFVTIIIYILIIAISGLLHERKKDDNNYVFFFYVTVFAFVLFIARYVAAGVMERMSFFFSFGQMVILSAIPGNFKVNERKLVALMMIMFMTVYGMYKFATTGMAPYNFMW